MHLTENGKKAGSPAFPEDHILERFLKVHRTLVEAVEDALEDVPLSERKEIRKQFHFLDQKLELLILSELSPPD